VPSLDLRFADNKSLVDAVTGASLVTFTRASSGTFVGSDGVLQTATNDVPRFDHNPTTGESLGLLVEEQRTNLLTFSEQFDNAAWGTNNTTISADAAVAPNGATTADKMVETATTGTHDIRRLSISFTSGLPYTNSIYAKADGRSLLLITLPSAAFGSAAAARFDLAAVTATVTTSATNTIASIQPIGDGWYRCSLKSDATATATGNVFWNIQETTGSTSYAGDITKGLFLWGAQLEAGAFPTSYIPTTTAAVTRSADVATDTTRGAALRTLYAQFRSPASGTRPVVSLDDNTANERIEILTSGSDPKLLVTDGGSAVADLDAGAVSANTTARIAARFNTDDYAISINGGTSQLDAAGTLPTATRIRIGSNQAGGYLNGTIQRITGWDSPLNLMEQLSQ
jgi:hypothetical protein